MKSAFLFTCAALLACWHALPARASLPARAVQDAALSYRNAEWGSAFDKFAALANKGHADAARIALFMHLHGPAMYGRYWKASPEEVHRWRNLAAPAARGDGRMATDRAH